MPPPEDRRRRPTATTPDRPRHRAPEADREPETPVIGLPAVVEAATRPDAAPATHGRRGAPRRADTGTTADARTTVDATTRTPGDETRSDAPHEDPDETPAEPAAGRAGRRRRPTTPQGHGHGHGHIPAGPSARRVRVLIAALLVPCALATLVGLVVLWPRSGAPSTVARPSTPVDAQVVAAQRADCTPGDGTNACLGLTVRMEDGPLPGRDLVQILPVEPSTPRFAVGDEIVLQWSGADPLDPGSYQVVDFQRGPPLIWLAVLFAAAVLVLGRWRGLAALVALGMTFVVLLVFVLPSIVSGHDPLAVAIVGSCLVMFVVLYLTHGLSARTSTAVLGTLASLALIGVLGTVFAGAARLTGLDDQTANLIATLGAPVDARGLLLAGFVIGALGVLDDVTVTQTSAVWELRAANPDLSAAGLFAAAMRIGRDHVSSAVNTLVLAYAGASLPLMLIFSVSGDGLGHVLTIGDVATEIVRTLVGSIGLVASVPITTGLAALVASREPRPDPATR
ncbi:MULTISPECIES: YibE/F family protein [unclassified Pseudonocardia]|uniref:YibE/F family protein n=1 Tax=unclassified Pseudonocardia TaxID=2619320 RepID=UPI000B09CD26|nr:MULTISPECIES: YibE/F family protein [unclassified Pseudonocardia]